MIIEREQDGLWFSFEERDWHGDWRTLVGFVKAYKRHGWDGDNQRWWIGEEHIEEFMQHKRQLIDDLLNPGQEVLDL